MVDFGGRWGPGKGNKNINKRGVLIWNCQWGGEKIGRRKGVV